MELDRPYSPSPWTLLYPGLVNGDTRMAGVWDERTRHVMRQTSVSGTCSYLLYSVVKPTSWYSDKDVEMR
jgi:hypothetical protein